MQKRSLFNFNQFSGIFEDDSENEDGGVPVKAIDIVMSIFFQMYGTIVTRLGGYREAVQDYQKIANSENDKRGDLMVAAIDKISKIALEKNPDLRNAIEEYKKSMGFLKQAYDKILLEDKNQLLNIKKKIKDMIISYLDALVKNVKGTELPELEKKNESSEYIGDLLLEKDLYQKERRTVIKSILPLRAKAFDLSTKSLFSEVKSSAKNSLKVYDRIIKTLQDDNIFDGKKRAERAEEIEKSKLDIIATENELNKTLSSITIKYGIAKEIDGILKKSIASLTSANDILKQIETKKDAEKEKNKIEDSESEKKKEDKEEKEGDKEYKEIKEGGKDQEGVKKIQSKLNKILPEGSRLEENGKYEDDMKKSIPKIVEIMKTLGVVDKNYKADPSKMTVEFQKYLDEYIDKIEQIRKDLPKN